MTDSSHKTQSLATEFGQRVSVTREDESSADTKQAAELLMQAGLLLDPVSPPGTLKYLGACAVHVYQSEILEQLVFVTQMPLGKIAEPLADRAIQALRSDIQVAYGRKRRTLRSGL